MLSYPLLSLIGSHLQRLLATRYRVARKALLRCELSYARAVSIFF
jgi:hypothetical protein